MGPQTDHSGWCFGSLLERIVTITLKTTFKRSLKEKFNFQISVVKVVVHGSVHTGERIEAEVLNL